MTVAAAVVALPLLHSGDLWHLQCVLNDDYFVVAVDDDADDDADVDDGGDDDDVQLLLLLLLMLLPVEAVLTMVVRRFVLSPTYQDAGDL